MVKQLQLFEEEPAPFTLEAQEETRKFEVSVDTFLAPLQEIKFKILVWGPSLRSPSAVALKRREIYRQLKDIEHHHCWFSEDLKSRPDVSLKTLELAQAMQADLIILLVEDHADGPIGEMHDFCDHPKLITKFYLLIPRSMEQT